MGGVEFGKNFIAKLFTDVKLPNETTVKNNGFTTFPTIDNVDNTDTPWAKMLGVDVPKTSVGEAYFSDDMLSAFITEYAPKATPEMVEDITSSIDGVTGAMEVAEILPTETEGTLSPADHYIGHQVDGTAERIENYNGSRLFAEDIAEAAQGDAELLNLAGAMFHLAA